MIAMTTSSSMSVNPRVLREELRIAAHAISLTPETNLSRARKRAEAFLVECEVDAKHIGKVLVESRVCGNLGRGLYREAISQDRPVIVVTSN